MATTNLDVQYHQQDTNYYCGAACAQMVLAQIGAGLLDQDDLYDDNHSHSLIETNWYSGPDGVQWTLMNRKPAAFTNSFVLFALSSEDSISRKIVWTIHHYQVAPIALVYGWAHWIVVRGYDVSAHPSSSSDVGYTINAFDVNNPWPPTPSPAPPPPHSLGDVCGGGGDYGIANEHISYATWQDDYMTGVPGGYWSGKFLAVCDPAPASERHGNSVRPKHLFDGNTLLSRENAVESALAGIKAYGLNNKKNWNKVFTKNTPGEPVMVQRLDRNDSYYYIVPFETEKKISSLVSVDGRYGDYKQACMLPKAGPHLGLAYDKKKVIKMMVNNKFELPKRAGRILVRPDSYCLYPYLVWRPCKESLSPFWPFYMFTVGRQRIYVRVDGAVFTKLTTNLKGI